MSSLSRSEVTLLTICVLTVFMVGNAIAWHSYQAKVEEVATAISQIESSRLIPKVEQPEPKEDRDKEDFWNERMKWLDEQLPKMEGRDIAQSDLLEWMQEGAKRRDLTIRNQSFMKPGDSKHYREIGVTMKVEGLERQVYQWLSEMQSPTKFQAIKFLSMSPEGRGSRPMAECTVTLARWYQR